MPRPFFNNWRTPVLQEDMGNSKDMSMQCEGKADEVSVRRLKAVLMEEMEKSLDEKLAGINHHPPSSMPQLVSNNTARREAHTPWAPIAPLNTSAVLHCGPSPHFASLSTTTTSFTEPSSASATSCSASGSKLAVATRFLCMGGGDSPRGSSRVAPNDGREAVGLGPK